MTTKPPTWRDNVVQWRERPLTLGEPHEGFFYPDPLGFWAEVRRWVTELLRLVEPAWGAAEALSVSALLHVGEEPDRLVRARELTRPRLLLFLDQPSWSASGIEATDVEPHHIPDPHRRAQVYEGFWARLDDGATVGKSPQHPAAHQLYGADDLTAFLQAAPVPIGAASTATN